MNDTFFGCIIYPIKSSKYENGHVESNKQLNAKSFLCLEGSSLGHFNFIHYYFAFTLRSCTCLIFRWYPFFPKIWSPQFLYARLVKKFLWLKKSFHRGRRAWGVIGTWQWELWSKVVDSIPGSPSQQFSNPR